MKSAMLVFVLLFATLLPAQTPRLSDPPVISVQELAMPGKAVKAFDKGTGLLMRGDPQGSIAYFQKVIALAPECFRPYHNLGLALYRTGQWDAAIENFQKAIDLSKGDFAPSLFALAMILYQRADFQEAERVIQRGLCVSPGSAVGKYCLGMVLFSIGRLAEARRSALEALRLDPAEIDAHVLLAHIQEHLHNPDGVIAEARTYLRLSPKGDLEGDAERLLVRAEREQARVAAGCAEVGAESSGRRVDRRVGAGCGP
jgi:tetratricopeptide (TPR) repeat protein